MTQIAGKLDQKNAWTDIVLACGVFLREVHIDVTILPNKSADYFFR